MKCNCAEDYRKDNRHMPDCPVGEFYRVQKMCFDKTFPELKDMGMLEMINEAGNRSRITHSLNVIKKELGL